MSVTGGESNGERVEKLKQSTERDIIITKQAKCLFSFYDDISRSFDAARQHILQRKNIGENQRQIILRDLTTFHNTCKQTLNYVAENQFIISQSLPRKGPVIICGLPRTGTTLLYNLLACDPNCRAPYNTDMLVDIVPPISRLDLAQQQRRVDMLQKSGTESKGLLNLTRQIATAHPSFRIEEDFVILRQASFFIYFTWFTLGGEQQSTTWLDYEMNKAYAYDYHEVFLRMLGSVDMPSSHWLLKCPMHCFFFDEILRHYPDARFIVNHRRLDEVLPSLCSLSIIFSRARLDLDNEESRSDIVQRCIQFADRIIDCIMKFHRSQKEKAKALFHVTYEELMKDPIETVHQIYQYFDLEWSTEFETAMKVWLSENPQGKQGRHSYSLETFNLKYGDMETRHSDYIKLFLSK